MIATAEVERRKYSDAEKRAAVKRFNERGSKSVKDLSIELCISEHNLYYWARQHRDRVEEQQQQRKESALAKRPVTIEVESPQEQLAESPLSTNERDELLLLRAENHRLKAMLRAGL